MNQTIEGLRTNNKLLLLNREQQISLAKSITAVFNKDDPNWKKVLDLSSQIDINWETLQEKEKAMDKFLSIESQGSKLASKFVSSMFEGNSMATSLESSEREDSVVMEIKKTDKVKTPRPFMHDTSGLILDIESDDDEEVEELKPAAVTQQDETELELDSEDNKDKHDVDFVSF
jgi:hypothetical protein